ncbi:hypothetical protein ACP4OV_006557 [Aristida adscensionis]
MTNIPPWSVEIPVICSPRGDWRWTAAPRNYGSSNGDGSSELRRVAMNCCSTELRRMDLAAAQTGEAHGGGVWACGWSDTKISEGSEAAARENYPGALSQNVPTSSEGVSGRWIRRNGALLAFLTAATTTLLHTISESEKASYVGHIDVYLADDPFLEDAHPIDPTTDHLFHITKDGVLLCKLINLAVPSTIDERAINTKKVLNLWEKNENHTLCLNSANAIGSTVVNIGTQDLAEGRPHLVLGLISQIIKIQLLADVNLKSTPQLVELVEDSKEMEELMSLSPEKILLRWMSFQLKKGGFQRTVTNFSSDIKSFLWQLMQYNILQLLKNLRFHSNGKEITDSDILAWANKKVKDSGKNHSRMESFKDEEKQMNASYIISVARKLGCSIFLLPEDICEPEDDANSDSKHHVLVLEKANIIFIGL